MPALARSRHSSPRLSMVILRKLEYLREGGQNKHVRDVRFILATTGINRAFLESEVRRLSVQA